MGTHAWQDELHLHEVAGPLAALVARLEQAEVDEETGEVAASPDLLAAIEAERVELEPAVEAVALRARARELRAEMILKEAIRLQELSRDLQARADVELKLARRYQGAIRTAMLATGTKKLRAAMFKSISLRNGALSVAEDDAAAVPVEFRRAPAPPPPPSQWPVDKSLALEFLKERVPEVPKGALAAAGVIPETENVIPGLRLVRGEPTLSIK